jgi:hypothetical protein
MADVTGRIGDNEVELNNAATEATLKALLLASAGSVKEMKKLAKLAEKAGMDARAIQQAEEAVAALGENSSSAAGTMGKLNPILGALGKGASFLGNVLGDITASAFKTAGNLTSLAGELIDGAGAASDLAGAFKDLPFGLGLVASAFQKLLQLQEAELESYRQLTKAGINFGGSLTTIRLEALSLGMTLEQFGSVLTNNSVALASMGAGAEDGAKNFVKLAKDLRNSPMGEQLRALGFSAEETANGLANYIKMTGGRTAEEMRNTKGLTESAGQYMKQLDMLAALTGKSREEQEKALQEEAANAQFQAYLQTLSEDERKKAMAGFQNALATGGKGAADLFRSKLQGIPPLTEAGQTFMAMSQNANKAMDAQVAAVKDSTKNMKDLDRANAGFRVALGQDGKKLVGPLGAALISAGGAMGDYASTAISTQTQLANQNVKSVEDEIALREKLREEQERQASAAAKAAETEKAMRDMGAKVYQALIPAIQFLTNEVNKLIPQFASMATDAAPAVGRALKDIVQWIKDLIDPKTREEAIKKLTDTIGEILGKVFQKIWDNFSLFGGSKTEGREQNPDGTYDYEQHQNAPAAANGAVLSGPKSGFNAILHGTEAVVPLPDGRTIPVELDMSMPNAMKFQQPDVTSLIAEMQKTMKTQQANSFSNLEETITSFFGNKSDTTETADTGKILITELQTLNKQTAEMLAYVRDTADTGRRSIDALRGLSGNLYPV